ncbi:MAG: zinc-dependent alcohol dehydrogenase family protein [Planctomycetes bacterium]|nr:zinc-dependent alcohol dehydrogenase family protein [Planctomycetota bacterium]MBL7146508.1 zinc-dependent alcohol dehydrogenase family protein [Phycisphaerae bacterium]
MRAMILNKHAPIEEKPLELVDLPKPTVDNNQILIKISVCGACHTDLDEAEGRLKPTKPSIVPGHQAVGKVADKGKDVTKFKIGDRVGITWLNSSCGKCDFCQTGNENLCSQAKWTGKDVNGGYSEFTVIGEDFAYPIPEIFSDSQAAPLLCAGVIGYRTLRLADITDGQKIGLFGFGASAHIVIQIIKYKFPNSPVYVFTKTAKHAELAKSLGAVWTGRSSDQPPDKLNKIMDFTPVGQCVRDALGVLEKGGRLIINAIRKETPVPPLEYAKYLWLEKEIKSVANVTRLDAEEFLPLAARIPIKPTFEIFPLSQANEVLCSIKNSRLRAAAVLEI